MIPILYSNTETQFTSNGIGRLRDCISCTVTEERNGKFECEFQYPVTGKRYSDIEEGCIISVTHDDNHDRQPFRIYRRSAPINGIVTFNARHISYDLNNIILQPFTGTSVTATFAQINGKSINTNPFTFWTDKITVADFTLEQPASVRAILGGVRGSILDVYGGEYAFDGYTVKLYNNRGNDTDITLRYGKNIIDLEQTLDSGEIYDACVPFWFQDGTLVTVNGYIVSHGQTANRIVALDMTQMFEDEPTSSQLQSAAQSYLANNKTWVPKENIKVDFVALWQTQEYKDVAALQRVRLCDTVNVYVPHLGVTIDDVKVVKVVYNVLADRYDEIELGEAKSTFAQTLTGEIKNIVESATRNVVTKSVLQAEIDRNTQLITGGLGGHVVYKLNADGQPEEILVMDTDDIQTAVNVWRWNMGGFAHSHTGYNGPFGDIALTADGHINASMITVGTLSANLIRAGVISDAQGKSYWDLDSGLLNLVGDLKISKNGLTADISNVTYPYLDYYTKDITNRTDPGFEIVGTSSDYNEKNAFVRYRSLQYIGSVVKYISRIINIHEQYGIATTTRIDPPTTGNSLGKDAYVYHHIDSTTGETDDYITIVDRLNGYREQLRIPGKKDSLYEFAYSNEGLRFALNTDVGNDIIFGLYKQGYNSDHGRTATLLDLIIQEGDGSGYAADQVRITSTGQKFLMKGFKSGNNVKTMLSITNTSSCVITDSSAVINGKTVAYTSTSSRRYKENIKPVEDSELDSHRLYDLEVKQFRYHDGMILQYDDMANKTHVGFIAEEVNEIYPDAVIHDMETGQVESWDERRIIPPMLKLIQEQKTKIDELDARIARLETLVEALMKG